MLAVGLHDHRYRLKAYDTATLHADCELDWVQDAAREQLRRRARRQEKAGFFEREGGIGWRRKVWESYDAGQGWILVTIIGQE